LAFKETDCQFCEKFHQVDTKTYINYSKSTKTTYCFIDVLASRRKPSSGLTSGAGRQYIKTQEDRQLESRRGELPVEPCMGQVFTY